MKCAAFVVLLGCASPTTADREQRILTALSDDNWLWTLRDPETNRDLEDVAFGDDLFVVVGRKAVIRNSTDGLDWY